MRLPLIPRLAVLSLLVLGSSTLTAFAQTTTLEAPWERTLPAAGLAVLNLNTPNGTIAVEGWDRPEIAVRATRRASGASPADAQRLLDSIRIEFAQEGTTLRGDVPEPRRVESVGVDFVVRVPRDLAVDARTAHGTIAATGVAGPLSITSGDGSLSVANAPGPMTLETSNGSVAVALAPGACAQLDLTTASGQISVQGTAAPANQVRALIGGGGPPITVRTSSGSIAVN